MTRLYKLTDDLTSRISRATTYTELRDILEFGLVAVENQLKQYTKKKEVLRKR